MTVSLVAICNRSNPRRLQGIDFFSISQLLVWQYVIDHLAWILALFDLIATFENPLTV
jgi:hypothetical protein